MIGRRQPLATLADVDAVIPAGPSHGYRGPWVAWYLRTLFYPAVGYENARDIVARAPGPDFDYEAPHNTACAGTPRGARA